MDADPRIRRKEVMAPETNTLELGCSAQRGQSLDQVYITYQGFILTLLKPDGFSWSGGICCSSQQPWMCCHRGSTCARELSIQVIFTQTRVSLCTIVSLESDDGEAGDGSSSNNEVKLSRLVHLKGAWCQSARLPRRGFESRGFNSNHLRYEKIIICLLLFSTKQGNELFKPILCLVAPFHSRLQSPDILKVCT